MRTTTSQSVASGWTGWTMSRGPTNPDSQKSTKKVSLGAELQCSIFVLRPGTDSCIIVNIWVDVLYYWVYDSLPLFGRVPQCSLLFGTVLLHACDISRHGCDLRISTLFRCTLYDIICDLSRHSTTWMRNPQKF